MSETWQLPDRAESARLAAEMAARAHRSGTSFLAGMQILPEAGRNAMYAIYAFCREVDDIADEGGTQEEKRQGLAFWRREIDRLYKGQPTHDIARALMRPIREMGLQKQDFLDVIAGMEMDAEGPVVAPDLTTLDLYCDRVASAVGRLSVRAFGDWRPRADDVAHHLGRALQLTNILRDISEDAAEGRLYLPREYLDQEGVPHDPAAASNHSALPKVSARIAAIAHDHYTEATKAMADCPKSAMRPARIMAAVYRRVLDELSARGFSVGGPRISLTRSRKAAIALRAAFL